MMETLYYKGRDGRRRAGHFHDHGRRAVIVGCHGLFSWKGDEQSKMARLAVEAGLRDISLFRFDCLGCGESEGRFEESTLDQRITDSEDAISFVYRTFLDESVPLILLGSSFGGPVVLCVASQWDKPPAGIVTWSAPLDLLRLYKARYGHFFQRWSRGKMVNIEQDGRVFVLSPRFPAALEEIDVQSRIAVLTNTPVCIIHGDSDETVPVEQAHLLASLYPGPSMLSIIAGGQHRLEEHFADVAAVTMTWIEKQLSEED